MVIHGYGKIHEGACRRWCLGKTVYPCAEGSITPTHALKGNMRHPRKGNRTTPPEHSSGRDKLSSHSFQSSGRQPDRELQRTPGDMCGRQTLLAWESSQTSVFIPSNDAVLEMVLEEGSEGLSCGLRNWFALCS